MKIAFCTRSDLMTRTGGDTVQILKTKEALERDFNVEITIVTKCDEITDAFDIIHIFNLSLIEDATSYFERARRLGKKTVLSPIYWDYSYAALSSFRNLLGIYYMNRWLIKFELGLIKFISFFSSKPKLISRDLQRKFAILLREVDVILPNSMEELDKLSRFTKSNFNELSKKSVIVVNAATEPIRQEISKERFLAKFKIPDGYILQVGRIEFIKNQIQTLKSLFDAPEMPIVFVGRIFEQKYFEELKSLASLRGNVFFINEVEHHEISLFYAFAKLHVLPSLRESPGLVNLEAMLNSCKVVVSDERFGPINTYFGHHARIINPLSVTSLREGIMLELKTYRDSMEIENYIKSRFTWSIAANQTFSAYKILI